MKIICPHCNDEQIWIVVECENCNEPIDISELLDKCKLKKE